MNSTSMSNQLFMNYSSLLDVQSTSDDLVPIINNELSSFSSIEIDDQFLDGLNNIDLDLFNTFDDDLEQNFDGFLLTNDETNTLAPYLASNETTTQFDSSNTSEGYFDLNAVMKLTETLVDYEEQSIDCLHINSSLKRKSIESCDFDNDTMSDSDQQSSNDDAKSVAQSSSASTSAKRKRVKLSDDVSKKRSNKEAATRYRQKKVKQKEDLFRERDEYEKENGELKKKIDDIQIEINFVKNILVEMLLKKNVLSNINIGTS